MSAIGSASARGPGNVIRHDTASSFPYWLVRRTGQDGSIRSFLQQRLQRRMLQRLGGGWIVEHLLEGRHNPCALRIS